MSCVYVCSVCVCLSVCLSVLCTFLALFSYQERETSRLVGLNSTQALGMQCMCVSVCLSVAQGTRHLQCPYDDLNAERK